MSAWNDWDAKHDDIGLYQVICGLFLALIGLVAIQMAL